MQWILAFGRRGIFADLRASSKLLQLHNHVLLAHSPCSVHRVLSFGQSTLYFGISYGSRTSILNRTLSSTPFQLSRFQDEDPDQNSYSIREEGRRDFSEMSREGRQRRGRDPQKEKQEEKGGRDFSEMEERSRGGWRRRGRAPQKVKQEEEGGKEMEERSSGGWQRRGRDPQKVKREEEGSREMEERSSGGWQRRGRDPQKVKQEEEGGREMEERSSGGWQRRGRDPQKVKQEEEGGREMEERSSGGWQRRGRDPQKVKQEEEGGREMEERSSGGWRRRGRDPQKVKQEEEGGREMEERSSGGWQRRGRDPWKLKRERFNRHMLNLIRKENMEEAEDVFQYMRNGNIYPDTVSFNVLISGYANKGDIKKAFKLFNDLKKCALLPTNPTYTSLFKACARAGLESQEYLEKILAEIERRNVILNQITMNALISALAACKRHEEAFQVYLDMPKLRLEPSMYTFSSLLQAASKDQVGGLETAQRVWTEMLACGFQPDMYSCNLLLMCLRDAGIPKSMEQPVCGLGEKEVPRDLHENETETTDSEEITTKPVSSAAGEATSLVSWTLFPTQKQTPSERKSQLSGQRETKLTLSLGKSNLRWLEEGEVEQLLGSMQTAGLKPDIRTFQLLASLLVSAPFLLQQMEVHRVALDKKCVVTMIRAQALLGNLEEARGLLEVAEKLGLQLEQSGFQAVARGCTEQSQGMELLEEMKGLGMQPNVYVFGTLIGNAAKMKKYRYLSAVLKEMKLMEVLPNQTISDILETVARTVPTNAEAKKRHNGFSGYYRIWKRTMCPE